MENKELKGIGSRIALIRKENNMTQAELAAQLDLSPKHISHIERGMASFSTKNLIQFSKIFECDLNYILRGKQADSPLNKLPAEIVDILYTDSDTNITLLNEYLNLYLKLLHHS